MIDRLDSMLSFHSEALNLRERRQQILSSNIANADTPGYQARDIKFSDELNKILQQSQNRHQGVHAVTLHTTSEKHITSTALSYQPPDLNLLFRVPYQASADGNTVDMDKERTEFAENSVRYQSSLTFLGGQLKGLGSVMQQ